MTKRQLLFNPDLHPVQYMLDNGSMEITFDGKFQTFWLTQKEIARMFDLTQQAANAQIQNFKKVHAEIVGSTIKNFLLVQTEGNREIERTVEQYNLEVILFVGYRAQVTEKTVRFQRWAAEFIRQKIEDEHQRAMQKIKHARAADVTGYILSGKTQSHAERRVDMKSSLKQLNAIIIELTSPKMIGAVLNREYVLLFNKAAEELKTILHTKSIRDALPEMHLEYLDLAERNLIRILKSKESLTPEELMEIVDRTIRPLADNLREMCQVMGIDIITGRKLLGSGQS